jgi:DNA invertase Pin-like site-specific DNA recombinase
MSTHMGHSAKAVAYARVSTLLGQDPENQLVGIRQFAEARGFQLMQEYTDHGVSGAKESRPALDAMTQDARRGKFKVLIVAAIDRIGRNTRHLLNLLHELNGYGVSVISLRENLDFTTPLGSATLVILSAIASLERDILRERIRTALAAKKLAAQKSGKPWRCGRPEVATPDIAAQVHALRTQGLSIRAIERSLSGQISRGTVQRILKGLSNKGEKPCG